MAQLLERIAKQEVPRLLQQHLGVPVHATTRHDPQDHGIDLVAETPRGAFVIEIKANSSTGSLHSAVRQLKEMVRRRKRKGIPLLVVPYMGEKGRALCRIEGVSWMDLSGNAEIRTDRVVVDIQGKPNHFVQRGRPSSVFAPKSARVTRFLLQHPGTAYSQREIARAIALDEGYVSRIVRRLQQDELLKRDESGKVHVPDLDRLLEAWVDTEDFSRHRIQKGFVAAKTGDELVHRMSEALSHSKAPFAFTGLAGAWLLTRFATFRLSTVFVHAPPSPTILARAGFLEEPRGANCWIVVPRDEGVFEGAEPVHGTPCVNPVQVYIDLKGHPERAKEAAEEVRRKAVPWRSDASET